MGCYHKHFIFVWFMVILRTTDGAGTITWYKPPPVKTTADVNSIHTYNTQLIEGSTNVSLSWNFSLAADLNPIQDVTVYLNTFQVVNIAPAYDIAEVLAGYKDRFSVSWINPEKATLIIFNVSTADEGEFACKVKTFRGGTKIWTRKIQVTVVGPPSITHMSDNQTVNEGDNVTLNCTADGRPAPNITWIGASKNHSGSSFSLTIAGKEDEGIYTCTAYNGVGNLVSHTLSITVENYSPIDTDLSTNLTELTVTVGTSFNLNCSAQANPPAKYRFYKEQERLFNSTAGGGLAVHTTSVSERIPQVTYTCTPFNDFGDGPTDTITVMVHYEPTVTIQQCTTPVTEDENATLYCNVSGNPVPNTAWIKEGKVVSYNNRLVIANILRNESGSYECLAWNTIRNNDTKSCRIDVQYKPSVTIQQCSTPVTEGGNATLFCNATGNPVPNIAWMRAGEVVSYTKRLVIANISLSEAGGYECLAWNGAGNNDTKSCTVDVQYEPTVTIQQCSTPVTEGENATLYCNATGNPVPNTAWIKAGNVVSYSKRLVIANILRNESGSYECLAWNTIRNNDTKSCRIDVQYKPSVTIQQCSTPVTEGGNATLFCNATGNPVPNTAWIRGGEVVSYTKRFNIANISLSEAGGYECLAWNGVGNNDTKSCKVDVQYEPTVTIRHCSTPVTEGENATLYCNVTGNPVPNIAWIKAGNVVSYSKRLIIANILRNESGSYECQAWNTIRNNDTKSCTIDVQYKPSATIQQCSTPVTEGGNATLFCNATGNPVPNTAWIRGGEVVSYTKRLVIANISLSEAGGYECLTWNGVGNNDTKSCTVDVQYPPKLTIKPLSQDVVEGNGVTLFCNATGNPQPNITWTKEGNNTVLSSSETLTLSNLIRGDKGAVYKCKVQNNLGSNEATAVITVLFGPSVTFQQCSTPVNESDSATLYCNATGNPSPNITWIKANTGQVVPSNEMLVIANILRTDAGNYNCLASNGIGKNDTKCCTIDVYFPADIDSGPSVQQVVEGNGATLFCNATGNPRPNITWTKEGSNSVLSKSESLTLTNLTRKQNGSVYTCKVKNSLGPAKEASAMITVLVPPSAMIQQCLSPVTEGANATLYCNATGNPAPSIVWIRGSTGLVVSSNNMLTIEAIKRNESGSYKCLAWNGIGKNSTNSCTVDVHYPPVITKPQSRIHLINASESVTIKCLAEANPNATYAWKRATEVVSNDEYLHLNDVNDGHGGNYTCTARNSLNSASLTILVKVTRRDIAVEVTVENEEYLSDYDDLNSAAAKEFVRKFEEQVKKKCPTTLPACTIKVTRLRKGSVIVSFTLFFTTPVTTSEGLAELRAAVNNGSIGPYTVTSLKIIQQAEPTTTPSASTTGTVTTEKKTTSSPGGPPWVIIGAVIGGVVVFAVMVAIVTWCVHKKKKCRGKGIKIRHSGSGEQQAFSRQKGRFGAEDSAYAQFNHNYVGTGPPSANGFEALALNQRASAGGSDAAAHQQAAVAPPTCAVVDKSKNKEKKGKEKLGHTDADKSKKTAKKSKPEEIIYADLEDMNVPWTPTFSTFLGPLPPIKRPEPYENTQYADITQFLKSDATLPESDSNQGTELQPQGANKDEGGAEGEDGNTPM